MPPKATKRTPGPKAKRGGRGGGGRVSKSVPKEIVEIKQEEKVEKIEEVRVEENDEDDDEDPEEIFEDKIEDKLPAFTSKCPFIFLFVIFFLWHLIGVCQILVFGKNWIFFYGFCVNLIICHGLCWMVYVFICETVCVCVCVSVCLD